MGKEITLVMFPVLLGAIFTENAEMRVDGTISFTNNSAGNRGGKKVEYTPRSIPSGSLSVRVRLFTITEDQ